MESIESRIPPRARNKVPEFLKSQLLFIADSERSPSAAKILVKNPITIAFTGRAETGSPKTDGNSIAVPAEITIDANKPPEKPAMLLLGLAGIIPRLFLPKRFPASHAAESFRKTITKNKKIAPEFSQTLIFTKKYRKKDGYTAAENAAAMLLITFSMFT